MGGEKKKVKRQSSKSEKVVKKVLGTKKMGKEKEARS